jgi:hypothetical protein
LKLYHSVYCVGLYCGAIESYIECATVWDLEFDVPFHVRVHNPACSNCSILLPDIGTEFVFSLLVPSSPPLEVSMKTSLHA